MIILMLKVRKCEVFWNIIGVKDLHVTYMLNILDDLGQKVINTGHYRNHYHYYPLFSDVAPKSLQAC